MPHAVSKPPPFELTICGLDEIEGAFTHVLSILDPGTPSPAALRDYEGLRAHWVLRFDDVSVPCPGATPPGEADIVNLLQFERELQAASPPCHLLVHCHAGVSRSTAAAAILLAARAPGAEKEAVAAVQRVRPIARPNRRMIWLADRLLACDGRLIAAAENL